MVPDRIRPILARVLAGSKALSRAVERGPHLMSGSENTWNSTMMPTGRRGQELRDAERRSSARAVHRGEGMTCSDEWFQDYDDKFALKGDETGEAEARFIKRVLHLRKGRSVLDIPCGAGRIAFHLARAGCKVTGVDLTPSYVPKARSRFRRESLPGKFLCRDMREIDFHNEFHAAFNWQGSFGIFSDEENLEVLSRYATALRPGGRVLIDQPNREYILRHFRATRETGNVRSETVWNRKTERIITSFSETRGRKSRRWHLSMRFYTPAQFRDLFRAAGLEVEAMYGGLDARLYDRGSRRIHVVGRKA